MNLPPPTPIEPTKENSMSRKKKILIGAGIAVGVMVVISALSDSDGPESVPLPTTPATTEAPTTTQPPTTTSTTTTTTTTPPPPPTLNFESPEMQELFVMELWYDTGFCYTDCTREYTPGEWLDAGEGYGRYSANDILVFHNYLLTEEVGNLYAMCDDFWNLPDYEVAEAAEVNGLEGGAAIVASYIWCDS